MNTKTVLLLAVSVATMGAIVICALAQEKKTEPVRMDLLSAAVGKKGGTILLYKTSSRGLLIRVNEGESRIDARVELESLPKEAEVVEARAIQFVNGFAVCYVAREGDHYSYWYGANSNLVTNWLHNRVFENEDSPYRILDLITTEGDTLVMTFRRDHLSKGTNWWRHSNPQVDEKIFVDVCAPMFAQQFEIEATRKVKSKGDKAP